MEGQVWVMVEALLRLVEGRRVRCRYSDREVLRVSLWAILHDRPMSWGCRAENWPAKLCPPRLRARPGKRGEVRMRSGLGVRCVL